MPRPVPKKEQILDAAIEEFQKNGFLGASMDRIAESAKVSKRTVYNHFESKEHLFRAIMELVLDQLIETVDVRFQPDHPLKPQLLELARAEGKFLRSEKYMRLFRLVLGETIRDPKLAHVLESGAGRVSVFDDFMKDAYAAGALNSSDFAEASEQFISLIKYRAFWPYIVSGHIITADEMETIAQNSAETFYARFASNTSK